jgi:CRP-like cAMP-binding protein
LCIISNLSQALVTERHNMLPLARRDLIVNHPSLSDLHIFIARLLMHSNLSAEEQRVLSALPNRAQNVLVNRDLIRLDQQTFDACVVVDGLVGRFGQNRDGERQITALYIPGDMADLHAAVWPDSTSALQALADSSVLFVPHVALRSAAASYPGIAEAFWRECAIDGAAVARWVINVGSRSARTRLAHLFCEMAIRYGAKQNEPVSYLFPASQQHIGDMTALTSVHVNRTLRGLREEGLVRMHVKKVEILNWAGLQIAGEFDSNYLGTHRRAAKPVRFFDAA